MIRLVVLSISIGMLVLAANSKANDHSLKQVKMVASQFEPYSGADLLEGGLINEITAKAFHRVGYNVTFVYRPWKRAVIELKQGRWDGLTGVYHSKKREHTMLLSDPILMTRGTFYALKRKNISFSPSSDLKPYKIAVERGAFFDINLRARKVDTAQTSNLEQAIKMLLSDRVDLVLTGNDYMQYNLCHKFSPSEKRQIREISPSYISNTVHNAFTRNTLGSKNIVAAFNEGLKLLKAEGTFDEIVKRHQLPDNC